jgi:ribosomal protein S18 acetylase RimI-like enzyme
MGGAARLVDQVAHRYAGGRWLATGGGGYDVYRVVPRSWSLVWLAGAHREVPVSTPPAWRDRWAAEAARYGQAPLPEPFEDAPNAGLEWDDAQAAAEERSLATASLVRRLVVPRLLQVASDRGWWDPAAVADGAGPATTRAGPATPGVGRPAILDSVDASTWARLALAPRVIAPADPGAGHALVLAAVRDGAVVTAAVEGTLVVGLAVAGPTDEQAGREILALGVAPAFRRRGLAGALLAACVSVGRPGDVDHIAAFTLAERDPVEPLDVVLRTRIARRLLEKAGFRVGPADDPGIRSADPSAASATRSRLGSAT